VKASQQLMGELTSTRVQPARPFTTVGINYAGSIVLRLGSTRSKQTTKGYFAIFVFFVTQAVHIEVVTSLTTEAFLAALRYFIAHQVRLRVIHSNIGTNVQGVQSAPGGTTRFNVQPRWRGSRILTTEGCNWKFIPPHAPHFGGLWEVAVNYMKYHLWQI